MSKKTIKSDLKRVDAMKDEDIDYSEIPELDEAFSEARVVLLSGKKQLTIRLDEDMLKWLKTQGKGYQSRINAICEPTMKPITATPGPEAAPGRATPVAQPALATEWGGWVAGPLPTYSIVGSNPQST